MDEFDFEKLFDSIVGEDFVEEETVVYGSENKALIAYNLLYHLFRYLRSARGDFRRLEDPTFRALIEQPTRILREDYNIEPLEYLKEYSSILNELCSLEKDECDEACDELIESLDALDKQHEEMLDRLHMLRQVGTEEARVEVVKLVNLLRSQGVDTRE